MLASLGPNATDEQKEQVAKIAEAVRIFTVLSLITSGLLLYFDETQTVRGCSQITSPT